MTFNFFHTFDDYFLQNSINTSMTGDLGMWNMIISSEKYWSIKLNSTCILKWPMGQLPRKQSVSHFDKCSCENVFIYALIDMFIHKHIAMFFTIYLLEWLHLSPEGSGRENLVRHSSYKWHLLVSCCGVYLSHSARAVVLSQCFLQVPPERGQ